MKKIVLFMLLLLIGCSDEEVAISENGEFAIEYAQQLGYDVVEVTSEATFQYTEENINEPPNDQFWAVQTTKPDAFIGKDLVRVNLIVENHPVNENGETLLTLVLSEGEVIAGTSFPHTDDALMGGPYSLDGRTSEEL